MPTSKAAQARIGGQYGVLGLAHLGQDAHAVFVEDLPRFGRRGTAPALQHHGAEPLLQHLHTLADHRLGRAQPPCRLGNAAGIDHGHEGMHFREFVRDSRLPVRECVAWLAYATFSSSNPFRYSPSGNAASIG
jgi:hypothetical protein